MRSCLVFCAGTPISCWEMNLIMDWMSVGLGRSDCLNILCSLLYLLWSWSFWGMYANMLDSICICMYLYV